MFNNIHTPSGPRVYLVTKSVGINYIRRTNSRVVFPGETNSHQNPHPDFLLLLFPANQLLRFPLGPPKAFMIIYLLIIGISFTHSLISFDGRQHQIPLCSEYHRII